MATDTKQGLEAALRDVNDLIAITLRQLASAENSSLYTAAEKAPRLAALRAELAGLQAQQANLIQALNQLSLNGQRKTDSAGELAAQAQLARDDLASPGAPAPPVQTVQTPSGRIVVKITDAPTNAKSTPSEQSGAATVGTNANVVPITVSQAISSPPASGALPFNSKANAGEARASNSGTQIGVGAGADDAAQPITNSTQNRLSELYGGANAAIIPQDNILDQYASYTYSLSWYLLDPKTYNNLILLPNRNLTGYYLLAQTGGAPVQNAVPTQSGGTVGVGRNPYFFLDYYLDNFEFTTHYPGTPGARAASALNKVTFTVTEPNGITLLKNLYSAVTDVYNAMNISKPGTPVNYQAAQYCMIIRFYGYDTDGNLVQPIAQRSGVTDRSAVVEKFIPFSITNITFKVANKLVEYNIDGQGLEQVTNNSSIRGSIPQNFTFNGATAKEMLVGSITQPTASNAAGDQTRNSIPIQSSPPGNNNVQDPAQRQQALLNSIGNNGWGEG